MLLAQAATVVLTLHLVEKVTDRVEGDCKRLGVAVAVEIVEGRRWTVVLQQVAGPGIEHCRIAGTWNLPWVPTPIGRQIGVSHT